MSSAPPPTDSELPPGLWRVWSPLWRRRRGAHDRRLPWIAALLFTCAVAGSYGLVNQFNGWRGVTVWDPTSRWDARIPAWPPALLVYVTHLLYFPLLPLFCPAGARAHEAALRTVQALVRITLVSLACFLCVPGEIHVRAAMSGAVEGSAWGGLYEFMWMLDEPYNAWPSLHVSLTLVLAAWAARGCSRLARVGIGLAWCALAASIVLTKQHFVLDLVSGSALGGLTWLLLAPRWRALLHEQAAIQK